MFGHFVGLALKGLIFKAKLGDDLLVHFSILYQLWKTLKQLQKQQPELFFKKGVLKNFAKITGKHLWQILLFDKVEETPAQVFSR